MIRIFKLVLYFENYAGTTALPGQCILNTTRSLTHSLTLTLIPRLTHLSVFFTSGLISHYALDRKPPDRLVTTRNTTPPHVTGNHHGNSGCNGRNSDKSLS